MRVKELLQWGKNELRQSGVEEAGNDACLILECCLGKSRTEIFLYGESEVELKKQKEYFRLIKRRKTHEPIAYIFGQSEFWSLSFTVTPDVLIPRPETEFLIDRVLSLSSNESINSGPILDLCCGSGVIGIVLAKETGGRVVAVDISAAALNVAKVNRDRHGVRALIDFVQADLLSSFAIKRNISLIVSNPPYVSCVDLSNNLAPDVALFEPHLALDGGNRGMEVIEKIRKNIPGMLKPGGEIFMEIGADQGQDVRDLFQCKIVGLPDFDKVEILIDYAGRDRVLHARLLARE